MLGRRLLDAEPGVVGRECSLNEDSFVPDQPALTCDDPDLERR